MRAAQIHGFGMPEITVIEVVPRLPQPLGNIGFNRDDEVYGITNPAVL